MIMADVDEACGEPAVLRLGVSALDVRLFCSMVSLCFCPAECRSNVYSISWTSWPMGFHKPASLRLQASLLH